jgi:hypothetical protein
VPYLTPVRKRALDEGQPPISAGDLTYVLTRTCVAFLRPWGKTRRRPRYADYALVLGCLVATILELYRRRIGPYEDERLDENGDVYQ